MITYRRNVRFFLTAISSLANMHAILMVDITYKYIKRKKTKNILWYHRLPIKWFVAGWHKITFIYLIYRGFFVETIVNLETRRNRF